jgi:aminopeptidase N
MARMFARAILVLLALAPTLSAQSTQPFDVLHYKVTMSIPPSGNDIAFQVDISLKAKQQLSAVTLDLVGMTVDSVAHEGTPAKFHHADGALEVTLVKPIQPYRATVLTVRYHGTPADGLIIGKTKYGDRSIFADNWPDRARHWLVSRDHPSDKATVEFIVDAPEDLTVIANGRSEEITSLSERRKRWHFYEPAQIPVHCMVVGATRFSVLSAGSSGETAVTYYVYPSDRDSAMRQFGRTAEIIDYFSNRVGPYPYDDLAIVQSSTKFGGMENSGAIFIAEKPVGGTQSLERLMAHEIAHQWFGDSITQERWHDLWLSEGFATYYAALFAEHADGRDAFMKQMNAARTRYLTKYRTDPDPIFDPSIAKLNDLLNRNNYDKGAWVLHMLRRLIGDDAFHRGVSDYYVAYRDKNVSTDDFREVMERRADRDLDWFFEQWIFGRGYPLLVSSSEWSEADKKVKVTVTQNQPGAPFRMPLDIEIKTATGAKRFVLDVDERVESSSFALDGPPLSVVLDPDSWLLWE